MKHRVSNWSWREAGLAALAGAFLIGGAWLGAAASPAPPAEDELAARGALVFRRERCYFCHALGGSSPPTEPGSTARSGQAPARIGPDLGQAGPRRTDDWHLAHLLNPPAVVAGSAMPSFANLPQAELEALVAFLQAQGPPPAASTPTAPEAIPTLAETLDNYRAGQALYVAHCAGCHGEGGAGNGAVGQLLRPEPRDLTDVAWMSKQSDAVLFAMITDGTPKTAMPGYGRTLSPDERALLVRYLRYFADPLAKQYLEQGLAPPASTP